MGGSRNDITNTFELQRAHTTPAAANDVKVPLQKRVDLMMEREKEKQQWLDMQRQLRVIDEEKECSFKPNLIKSSRQTSRPSFEPQTAQ